MSLLDDLERNPDRIGLFAAELEAITRWSLDAVFELAKRGDDDEREMRLVGLEYRARLSLGRLKKTELA